VTKKSQPGLFTRLRTARGLSKHQLYKLSGLTEQTIRRLERSSSTAFGSTWIRALDALAPIGLINPEEAAEITAETGLTADTIAAINRRARASEPKPPPRKSPESRIRAVLDAHPSKADDFATLIEAAARLIK
jgi:transcriptional regulator with XRE-family HTH domain